MSDRYVIIGTGRMGLALGAALGGWLGITLGGWLGVVPADFLMSRDHLRGVKKRAERLSPRLATGHR